MEAIKLSDLNQMSATDFIALMGGIFESTPWIAELVAPARPFESIAALHTAMVAAVTEAGLDEQLALIRRHPDLAGRMAREGDVTQSSRDEQASAGLHLLTDAEYERFDRLNTAYRNRFGFPFIVAVRDTDKAGILSGFEIRLEHSLDEERREALRQIYRIAQLRLIGMLDDGADDIPPLPRDVDGAGSGGTYRPSTGKLTTHVLDTALGKPAAGMKIHLLQERGGKWHPLKTVITNDDGRIDGPVLVGDAFTPGRYELLFEVGAYYREAGVDLPEIPFLDEVPIRFGISDAGQHYHVPLLTSPFGCTTYRGS